MIKPSTETTMVWYARFEIHSTPPRRRRLNELVPLNGTTAKEDEGEFIRHYVMPAKPALIRRGSFPQNSLTLDNRQGECFESFHFTPDTITCNLLHFESLGKLRQAIQIREWRDIKEGYKQ